MLWVGMLLAFQEASPAAGAPQARGWDDFPVFVWREKYAGKPLPEELIGPFGGVILMREEDSSWARERGLSYLVWNVAGRDALHLDADEAWNARVEQWIQTHDEKLLVREPCLNDPETLEQLCTTLDATIAKHGEHPGLGFVLGDEVSLTPNGDPFDMCRCAFCEGKWREFAKANGLPERTPLTDEVRLALHDDDFSTLGTWLARRRFERAGFAQLLFGLAQRIRGLPWASFCGPGSGVRLPVGILGIAGPTAFGGLDLALPLGGLDFFEVYPVRDLRELQLAMPELRPRSYVSSTTPSRGCLATIFLGDLSPESAAQGVWEHWLRGGNALVLWNDAALETHQAQRARLAETVEHIRAILQRFPHLVPPKPPNVALVQDVDSIAISWLKDSLLDGPTWPRRRTGFQEQHGTRENSIRAWIQRLEDHGILPACIPLARIDELASAFDVLILPHLCVLSDGDVEALGLRWRGSIVIEGNFGWVDRNGQPRAESPIQRLRALVPERVVSATPNDSGALDRVLGPAAVRMPSFAGDAATIPWLVAWRSTLATSWPSDVLPDELLVLLPRWDRAECRMRFPDGLALEIGAPSGTTLEPIYPPAGKKLPRGDAAVFLVRYLR